eukprot:g1586.t1
MKNNARQALLQLAALAMLVGVAVGKKAGKAGRGDPASQDAAAVSKEIDLILSKYTTLVMGVAVGASLPLTFRGYKIIPAVMFFTGAAFSGYGSYLLGDNFMATDFSGKAGTLIALSVVMGIVGGILAWKLRKLGVFLAAAAGGVASAFALNGAVLSHLPTLVHSVPQLYLYVACVILGVIAGILALKFEKMILTIATAASGAAMLVFGTKFFLEKFIPSMPTTTWGEPRVWIYLGSWLAIFLAGAIVQFSIVNKKKLEGTPRRKSLLAHEITTTTGPITGYETIVIATSKEQKASTSPSKMQFINAV